MSRRIALISEHASPLGTVGGVDGGGQNVYVGHVARHLAARGWEVDIFTRRDAETLPDIVYWHPGIRVIHVTAGPPCFVPKEQLLPFMSDFTASRPHRSAPPVRTICSTRTSGCPGWWPPRSRRRSAFHSS